MSRKGIATSPRIIAAVTKFPRPKTVKELQSFLGLTNYYRRFIPNYAQTTAPLHELTRKENGKLFQWTSQHEQIFETMKKALTTTPVLAFPNFDKTFIVTTDASGHAIGAVLSQIDDNGHEHPIAYERTVIWDADGFWIFWKKKGTGTACAVLILQVSSAKFNLKNDRVRKKT
jgi:hypothetical protein